MTATATTASAARRAAAAMDVVLVAVAILTMGFSLGNIHTFASSHGVGDPIAWFLAPAVDLALIGALMSDAFLSRHDLDAGRWATTLRLVAGGFTATLNVWDAVARGDAAGIVLHAVPPVLLFVLAEAATPYRMRFAEAVRRAQVDTVAAQVDTVAVDQVSTAVYVDTRPVSTPVADVAPELAAPLVGSVDTPASTPVSTPVADVVEVDSPVVARLSTEDARKVIEQGWKAGLSTRDVATGATRHPSYVARVYRELEAARGPQPISGQLSLVTAGATA